MARPWWELIKAFGCLLRGPLLRARNTSLQGLSLNLPLGFLWQKAGRTDHKSMKTDLDDNQVLCSVEQRNGEEEEELRMRMFGFIYFIIYVYIFFFCFCLEGFVSDLPLGFSPWGHRDWAVWSRGLSMTTRHCVHSSREEEIEWEVERGYMRRLGCVFPALRALDMEGLCRWEPMWGMCWDQFQTRGPSLLGKPP